MSLGRLLLVIAGLVLVSGVSGSAATAQSRTKIINVPQRKKAPKPADYRFPSRLVGGFKEEHTQAKEFSILSSTITHNIVGRNLTWVPVTDEDLPPLPLPNAPVPDWGQDVRFQDYVLSTDGEISIQHKMQGTNKEVGTCSGAASVTFPVAELPPQALTYFLLRLGSNGRYFLRMGMMGGYMKFKEKNSCTRQPMEINNVTVMLTPGFEGPRVYGVKGGLPQPRIEGGMTVTGEWDFAEPNPK